MDQQQRRPDGQTLNIGVVTRTPGGNWLIADVDDWQCLRQECSSPSNIVLQTPMNGGAEFVPHSLWNIKPMQLGMQQMRQTAIVLAGTSDDTTGGVQNLLKLDGDGLGCPSEHGTAIVYVRHYKGMN